MTLTPGIEQLEANVTVIQTGSGDITVGDGTFLFSAEFSRSGGDLTISGADGAQVVVVDYFEAGSPANLLSDGGAILSGELVNILAGPLAPGQYAQATGAQNGPTPIGTVVSATGNVAATRADGTSVTLAEGAPVFAGDVVLTATGSTVNMVFLDGTVFNMSESARMVLNNLVYEEGGSNNSMLFSILQGGFSFFAGQIAPTGDMQVTTPVATLGIRGTSPWVFSFDGRIFEYSIMPDPNDQKIGSYQLFSAIDGQPIATVFQTATKFVLNSASSLPQEVTKTPDELAADLLRQRELTDSFNAAQPFLQQLQGPGGQQRGDIEDGSQQDTSAPVPAAGPEFAQIQSSGINAESIAESQAEDIGQTETTNENSFALDPFGTTSGSGGSGGGGITSNELLSETSDEPPPIEPAPDSGGTTPLPEETSSAPVIILPDAPTITEDTSIVLNGFDIQDSSGSTLTVEILAQSTVTLASTAGLKFLEGDGTNDEFLIFEGSAEDINNALNGMTYIPTTDNDVVGGIDITVSNGNAEVTSSLKVIIEGENDAPVAVDDTVTVPEGDPLDNIAVLDNDFDVDGDDLTVISATAGNGTVSINPDNTLNYTPDEGFTGTDTIIYTVSDGADPEPLTDTASVNLQVTPDTSNVDPVANDDTARTSEDTTLTGIVVLSNDTDANEDPLTVTGATALNGTVVVNSDGTIDYTPNADFYGTDTIIYDISDGNGGSDTGAVVVTVDPVNDNPVAVDDTAQTDEDTPLNNIDLLANDEDVDGDQLSIIDASAEVGEVTFNDDGTINYIPLENFSGTDTVTYTIHDGSEATDTGTLIVTVNPVNDPPVADDEEVSTDEDTPIESIDVLTGDTDIDGGPLTVTSATSSQGNVTINTDGTLRFDPAGQFDNLGDGEVPDSTTATITYTVSDGAGGTDTGTVTVTVFGVNDDPVAADDAFTTDGTTILNGDLFADNGSGADSDVDDFDQIEVIEVDGITGAVGEPITLTSGATVTVGFDGTFSYDAIGIFDELGAGESTTDSFTYTISDFNGGTATATVNITIEGVNNAPVADDETASTNEDTPLLGIDVLTGDTDADGDTLIVSEAFADNGIVAINLDGTLDYSPNANFFGNETITYTVSDGNGGTDTGTVFVTVGPVNDNPVADDDTASTNEDTTISSIDVLAGDTDVDGDTLSVFEPTALNGSVFVNEDGTLNYTPDADFNGTDTITYSIHDGNDGTDTGQVTVTVAPVGDIADDTASTTQDTSVTVDVLSNDSFEDEGASVSNFTQGTNGSVFIGTGDSLTYTPGEGFIGTDTFEYTVASGGVTETATVTVTVGAGNSPPVAVDDNASTNEDATLSNINVLGNDFDPDEDTLTITAVSALNGEVIANLDGTLDYTPNANFFGEDTITYTIDDGNGGTAEGNVFVVVDPVNDAPIVDQGLTEQRTQPGTAVSYTIPADAFSDVEDLSSELTYTAQLAGGGDLPGWLTFDGTTFSGTPDAIDGGTITIEVIATDTGGLTASTVFDLSVDATQQGTPGDDTSLTGTPDDDFIDGLAGNDTIDGLGGNDLLVGGDGNDLLKGGLGDDTLVGGADTDVYEWSIGDGFDRIQSTGDTAQGDIIQILGSEHYDANWSWDANDLIVGAAINSDYDFNDTGSVRIEGFRTGDSSVAYFELDTAFSGFYSSSGSLSRIYLTSGTDGIDQGDFTELVLGTQGNDTMTSGGGYRDYIYGAGGDDIIFGDDATRSDLRGGDGNDELYGAGNIDRLAGGAGNDLMDGGGGIDVARYQRDNGPDGAFVNLSAVAVTMMFEGVMETVQAGQAIDTWNDIDTLVSIEDFDGSEQADIAIGSGEDNNLRGRGGNDFLDGGGGSDFLRGEDGNDTLKSGGAPLEWFGLDWLDGGDGNDELISEGGPSRLIGGQGNDTIRTTTTFSGDGFWDWANVDYKTSSGAIFANLTANDVTETVSGTSQLLTAGQVWDGFGTIDQIGSFDGETITGGVHVIRDSTLDDVILVSADYFNNFGNWIEVRLSEGDDFVDFTSMTGTARISWQNALGGVNASLETGTATDVNPSDNFIGTDTFIGATYLRGSTHDDLLFGNDGDNTFRASGGNDFIDGGRGVDGIDHSDSPDGITIDLARTSNQVIDDGHGTTDDLEGIEIAHGSIYDDQITGGGLNNELNGRQGNDVLAGGGGNDILRGDKGDQGGLLGGNDILDGGAGLDILIGGDGADIFVLRPGTEGDFINDFNTAQGDKIDVSAYGFTSVDQFANALIFDGANTIVNPDDNGTFIVQGVDLTAAPNSHFIFSTDLIVIDQFAAGDFDLIFDGAFYVLDQNNDPTSYGVTMTGTPTTTAFSLANAADQGRVTNFVGSGFTYDASFNLTGGTIDQISFTGPGASAPEQLADASGLNISAVAFFDALALAPSDDGAALDALFLSYQFDYSASAGADLFSGGAESDIISGGSDGDNLEGLAGNDWIEGDEGNDIIDGGDGDDTLAGGLDDDLLIGGAGADIYEWAAGDGFDTIRSTGDTSRGDVIKILGENWSGPLWSLQGNDLLVGPDDTGSLRIEGFLAGTSSVAYFELDSDANSFYSQDNNTTRIYLTSGNQGIDQGGHTELIYGSDVGETMTSGGGYRDFIYGRSGDDTIIGGEGNDILEGGEGIDTLTGGTGADLFVSDQLDVGIGDIITDYNVNEGDVVDLTELFEVNVNDDETVSQFVRINPDDTSQLQVDVDGFGEGAGWENVASLDTSGGINILYNLDGTDTSGNII